MAVRRFATWQQRATSIFAESASEIADRFAERFLSRMGLDAEDRELGRTDSVCLDGVAGSGSGAIAGERLATSRACCCTTLRSDVFWRGMELWQSTRVWRGW